jgi:8-oxo-dGTP pyrophosphatase MutT (NUDIX family)
VKQSVSLVIEDADGRLLLVRRPDDDESLPGVWGLPAASLEPGESEADAVRRAAREKLGLTVEPGRCLGEAVGERAGYRIRMRDFEATLLRGEPTLSRTGLGTRYADWRWGEPGDLVPAARAGSLCSQVLLSRRNLRW